MLFFPPVNGAWRELFLHFCLFLSETLVSSYPLLFSPLWLGNLQLPHRLVMGAMHLGIEGQKDLQQLVAFYRRRFAGGAGLVITGGIAVNTAGRGSESFLNFQQAADLDFLQKLVAALPGQLFCAQLFHAGRYAFHRQLVGAGPQRAPFVRYLPHVLSEEEIWQTIGDYASSARNARQAGFAAIEIMGSEGYLINQFFSPLTNQRHDSFGGNSENRRRFAVEIMRAVRAAVGPDWPVIFRLSAVDLVESQSSLAEVLALAGELRAAGASALNIGVGWHESKVPTIQFMVPRAAWSELAGLIRRQLPGLPIMVSNRINNPDLAEEILAKGEADLVSMARPFLADPDLVQKSRQNRAAEINNCVACNQACLDQVFQNQAVSCLVNPLAGQESKVAPALLGLGPKPSLARFAVVIGAGPAGLEAARLLALAGYRVSVYERQSSIGGQLQLAAQVPGKDEFQETIRYYQQVLPRLGVEVFCQSSPSVAALAAQAADLYVFATGSRPRQIAIEGLEKIAWASYQDFLSGKFVPGKKPLVIGGGAIALDVAYRLLLPKTRSKHEFLQFYQIDRQFGYQPGRFALGQRPDQELLLLKRQGGFGAGLGPTTRWALLQELEWLGAVFASQLEYQNFTEKGLWVKKKGSSERVFFAADSVLVCAGQEPENRLFANFKKDYPRLKAVATGAMLSEKCDARQATAMSLQLVSEILAGG